MSFGYRLPPERQALYDWAEVHDWPRLMISAYEVIIGGTAQMWDLSCTFMRAEQIERTQVAIRRWERQHEEW